MGWSATAAEVDNFVYEDANDTFIKDEAMQKRCSRRTRTRSATWSRRSWRRTAAATGTRTRRTSSGLQELRQEVEDRIEGIVWD